MCSLVSSLRSQREGGPPTLTRQCPVDSVISVTASPAASDDAHDRVELLQTISVGVLGFERTVLNSKL